MNENPPITLQDIAVRAGVSRMTISLALRNDPRLPAATRQRVQALAREMGYRGHSLVSALMVQLRKRKPAEHLTTLAFLTLGRAREEGRTASQLYRDYWAGATERANQLGYRLEEIWAKEPGMTGRRLTKILVARGVRGLIIGPLPIARGHLSLDWSRFAVAALGYSVWKPDMHRASVDHYQCMALAMRRLKRLGYRRIGFIISHASNERVDRRFLGAFLAYQDQLPRSNRVPPLVLRRWSEPAVSSWLRKASPEVVVCNATPLLRSLKNSGLRVPEQIGFVHLHQEEADYSCAGVHHNGKEVGTAVVDLVVGQLQRHEFGIPEQPRLVLVPGLWVDGPTVRSRIT